MKGDSFPDQKMRFVIENPPFGTPWGGKDTERVPFTEDIDDYMAREVLPHVPDAVATFEENLAKKKPVVKTGAEFPFTRYFHKYEKPRESAAVLAEIVALQQDIERGFKELAE